MTSKPEQPVDERLTGAHDLALAALHEITPADTVGPAAGYTAEDDGVVSLRFHTRLSGYPGWFWTVSVAVVEDADPTVLEVELLPGDGALLAPDWVPWATRLAEYHAAQAAAAEDDDDLDDEDDDVEDDDLDDESDDDEDEPKARFHAGDLDGVDIDELDATREDADSADDDTDDSADDASDDDSVDDSPEGDDPGDDSDDDDVDDDEDDADDDDIDEGERSY